MTHNLPLRLRWGAAAVSACTLLAAVVSPQTEWRPAGPFGGPAEVILTQAESGHLWAAARNGLLFRSTNGGARWHRVAFPLELNCTLHALLSPASDPPRLFAGISPRHPGASGLYTTPANGLRWDPVEAFLGRQVWSLAEFPGQPGIIAAGADDGVYLSRDGGKAWSRISPAGNADLAPVVALAFHPADSRVLYAGTTHLPWRTTDGGATWQSIHHGMLDDSDVFAIHVDPEEPSRILASACSGMYRSTDGGSRWVRLAGSADASYRTYAITQSPGDPNLVFAGTSHGLLRSANGGAAWRKVLNGPVKSIAFDRGNPARVYTAGGTGIHVSDDAGNSFAPSTAGFAARSTVSLAAAAGSLWTASAYDARGGLFQSLDGIAWRQTSGPALLAIASDPANPARLFGITSRSLHTSPDGGRTWTTLPAPAAMLHGLAVLPAPVAANGPAARKSAASRTSRKGSAKRLPRQKGRGARRRGAPRTAPAPARIPAGGIELWLATSKGLYKSGTGADPWSPLPVPSFEGRPVTFLAFDGARLMATTGKAAAVTSDRGRSWIPLPPPAEGAEWYQLAARGGAILAATSHGLFRAPGPGLPWERTSGSMGSDTATAVVFHATRPDVAFAARLGRVFASVDGGVNWRALPDGDLDQASVHSLVVMPGQPHLLYALAYGRGVYRIDWEKP